MKKMLGTRCPGCGTTDAPSMVWVENDSCELKAICTRCGFTADGKIPSQALSAFYGPQPEESEGLPPCRCGSDGDVRETTINGHDVICDNCGAATPYFPTAAEARACWRRMMEE